jgi:U3-containing 90S pre-ribosomal complex subunit
MEMIAESDRAAVHPERVAKELIKKIVVKNRDKISHSVFKLTICEDTTAAVYLEAHLREYCQKMDILPDNFIVAQSWIVELPRDLVTVYREHIGRLLSEGPGARKAVVICGSAIRSMDVIRDLKQLQKAESSSVKLKFGKLFSKHIKMPEQVKLLKHEKPNVLVGTPDRLVRLIDMGEIDLRAMDYVVLDASFKDSTQRTFLTAMDTRAKFFELYIKHMATMLKEDSARIKLIFA